MTYWDLRSSRRLGQENKLFEEAFSLRSDAPSNLKSAYYFFDKQMVGASLLNKKGLGTFWLAHRQKGIFWDPRIKN